MFLSRFYFWKFNSHDDRCSYCGHPIAEEFLEGRICALCLKELKELHHTEQVKTLSYRSRLLNFLKGV